MKATIANSAERVPTPCHHLPDNGSSLRSTIRSMSRSRRLRRPTSTELLYADTTDGIIGGFYEVYNTLGYGFLESVYSNALAIELTLRGLHVQREILLDVYYKDRHVGKYRVDFLVNSCVVVENKSTRYIVQADRDQALNGMRASMMQVGLLLHFGPRPRVYRLSQENRFG